MDCTNCDNNGRVICRYCVNHVAWFPAEKRLVEFTISVNHLGKALGVPPGYVLRGVTAEVGVVRVYLGHPSFPVVPQGATPPVIHPIWGEREDGSLVWQGFTEEKDPIAGPKTGVGRA